MTRRERIDAWTRGDPGETHWPGCEAEHIRCAVAMEIEARCKLAREFQAARIAIRDDRDLWRERALRLADPARRHQWAEMDMRAGIERKRTEETATAMQQVTDGRDEWEKGPT